MTVTIEERHAKLPKWAQARIENLERDLVAAQAALARGAEGSDTFVREGTSLTSRDYKPLGAGPTVYFGNGLDDYGVRSQFQVRYIVEEGKLLVSTTDGTMQVEPRAANAIECREARFKQGGRNVLA